MTNSKTLLTLIYLYSLILFFQNITQAQNIYIQRSTLSNSGSNPQIVYQGKNYIIKQSIGQQGISGTNTNKQKTIIQGYIQPELKAKNSIINIEELDVEIKQMSFSDYYIINVNDEINTLNLSIYNTLGQKKYTQDIKPLQETVLDLSSYSSGCYILYIQTNQKQFSTKLIKK